MKESEIIEISDEMELVRDRARVLQMALLGAPKSGVGFQDGAYFNALALQASDIVHQIDALAERLGGPPA
jgi:hypothetical protein